MSEQFGEYFGDVHSAIYNVLTDLRLFGAAKPNEWSGVDVDVREGDRPSPFSLAMVRLYVDDGVIRMILFTKVEVEMGRVSFEHVPYQVISAALRAILGADNLARAQAKAALR